MKRPHLFCIIRKFVVSVGAALWDQSEIGKIFILVTESQITLPNFTLKLIHLLSVVFLSQNGPIKLGFHSAYIQNSFNKSKIECMSSFHCPYCLNIKKKFQLNRPTNKAVLIFQSPLLERT